MKWHRTPFLVNIVIHLVFILFLSFFYSPCETLRELTVRSTRYIVQWHTYNSLYLSE